MLDITTSHCPDLLAKALVQRLGQDAASPFAPLEVVVPSAAQKRRLSLVMADSAGVCANVRFSFLAQWFWARMAEVLPVEKASPYAAERLSWRIFHILGDADFTGEHSRLYNWLKGNDEAGRHELALLLAGLFEQYLTYRPDWLKHWFDGKALTPQKAALQGKWPVADEAWQAALWRRIEKETGADGVHPATRFFEALAKDEAARATLPARLYVFGLPSIAPQYLEMLARLGEWVDVSLFVLNPCREFWFDVVDEKRLAALQKAGRRDFQETGNALLAAWGKERQSFLSQLLELDDDWRVLPERVPDAPSPLSLLETVKAAVLALGEPEVGTIADDDRSLEVHVCHSLMREVEVLHEQLLALFAQDNPPSPDEILVVTPDIDAAAPLVEAVFGVGMGGVQIPFRITGLSGGRTNPLARALCGVLALASSRLTAADVFDLLLQPAVARRFGLEDAAEQVYGWLNESGICWGLDGEQKTALGLPADDSRSFFDGFYRLFLAYAMPEGGMQPFGARLPAGSPEGSDALALGSLWQFVEALAGLRRRMETPMDAAGWQALLLDVLDGFVSPKAGTLEDDMAVRAAVAALAADMAATGDGRAVGAEVLQRALAKTLDGTARGSLPGGVVTVAPMAGLRGIPFRFVFVFGLNDGVFPAPSQAMEFDLMALAPRRGDFLRRESDRNAFLDLLLSAGERFSVSYTGRSVRDDSERPPSVLVSELLDTLVRALAEDTSLAKMQAARQAVESRLVVRHPLQAFSRRCFLPGADARMRSANDIFLEAQKARQKAALSPLPPLPDDSWDDDDEDAPEAFAGAPFFTDILAPPDEAWRDITLDDLAAFFTNPSRYLLTRRLGLAMPDAAAVLPTDEPMVAGGLDSHQLAARLVPMMLAGADDRAVMDSALAGTEFPPGALGRQQLAWLVADIRAFAGRIAADLAVAPVAPVIARLPFSLENESWSLFGALESVRENGLVFYRFAADDSDGSVRFRIRTWLEHLFFNAAAQQGYPARTVCWFSNLRAVFPPMGETAAKAILADLMALYRRGLSEPLRFFPVSAAAYMDGDERISEAEKKWKKGYGGWQGESENAFVQLAVRGLEKPLDDAFLECAARIFGPLNAHLQREVYDGDT